MLVCCMRPALRGLRAASCELRGLLVTRRRGHARRCGGRSRCVAQHTWRFPRRSLPDRASLPHTLFVHCVRLPPTLLVLVLFVLGWHGLRRQVDYAGGIQGEQDEKAEHRHLASLRRPEHLAQPYRQVQAHAATRAPRQVRTLAPGSPCAAAAPHAAHWRAVSTKGAFGTVQCK